MENPNHDKNMGKCALSHTVVDIYVSGVFLQSYLAVAQTVEGSKLLVPTTTFPEICPEEVIGKRPDARILIMTLFIIINLRMH